MKRAQNKKNSFTESILKSSKNFIVIFYVSFSKEEMVLINIMVYISVIITNIRGQLTPITLSSPCTSSLKWITNYDLQSQTIPKNQILEKITFLHNKILSLVSKTDSGIPNNTHLNNFDIFNKVFFL